MTNSIINRKLAEADLYGYSKWLASHLGYPIVPRSLRGFQHGWIWWEPEDANPVPGFGLDPNVDSYWGVLVQNNKIADHLNDRGLYSRACGLPFVNYYRHCGLSGSFKHLRNGAVLYVPTHSNPWNNRSDDILESAHRFAKLYGKSGVMLGWNDRHLSTELTGIFDRVEIGAGALEAESFLRLMNVFERYDYLITDSPGSHILYGLICGMKVGIHQHLYNEARDGKAHMKSIDYKKFKESIDYDKRNYVYSLEYLDRRFPGIVVDGGLPHYSKAPADIASSRPDVIAKLLGWDLTYESDLIELARSLSQGKQVKENAPSAIESALSATPA
jgi:hypothetical protein